MAKVKAPALSMGGGGQIGKTMVYGTWRGVPYVRQYVVPANPKSAGQQQTRGAFAWATSTWKSAGPVFKAAWTEFARGKALTDRNAFIGANTKALRGKSDLKDIVYSPGAGGGIQPVSATFTGAAGKVTMNVALPAAPTGWSISALNGFAVKQGDPMTLGMSTINEKTAAAPATTLDITGLAAGIYVCGAMLVWTKPDSSMAYSIAITGTATVT
jgi:hypothetical protein